LKFGGKEGKETTMSLVRINQGVPAEHIRIVSQPGYGNPIGNEA
jgi:hypothetical protein